MSRKLKNITGKVTMVAALSVSSVAMAGQALAKSTSNITAQQPPWYSAPTALQLHEAQTKIVSGTNFTQGPHGEKAFASNKIVINNAQLKKIRAGHFTAAIAMGYEGSSWPTLQMEGLQTEFRKLGIKVTTVTNANFKDAQQITDLQTIAAKKPDVVVSLPVNPTTESTAFKAIAKQGTKIVFMNQPADNMVAGKDYVSVVAPDDFGNGMDAADELAKAIHGKGDVLALYYQANFLTTNLRYEGFVARLMEKYPNIHLIGATGFNDPNQTESAASALITRYPNASGMWVAWSVPAAGAISAARTAGKSANQFHIVTEDLDVPTALNIAQSSYVYGLGAQRPYDAGVAEAEEAGLALIGAKTNPFVVIPNFALDRANLKSAYRLVMHETPPQDVLAALKG